MRSWSTWSCSIATQTSVTCQSRSSSSTLSRATQHTEKSVRHATKPSSSLRTRRVLALSSQEALLIRMLAPMPICTCNEPLKKSRFPWTTWRSKPAHTRRSRGRCPLCKVGFLSLTSIFSRYNQLKSADIQTRTISTLAWPAACLCSNSLEITSSSDLTNSIVGLTTNWIHRLLSCVTRTRIEVFTRISQKLLKTTGANTLDRRQRHQHSSKTPRRFPSLAARSMSLIQAIPPQAIHSCPQVTISPIKTIANNNRRQLQVKCCLR